MNIYRLWLMRHRLAVFLLLTFFIFGLITGVYAYTDKELADVSDKIIRLHVIANSDSPEDQALKLKVRDEVIRTMAPKFEKLQNAAEVKKVIQENLDNIESIADKVIKENCKNYQVAAKLGNFDFPTKVYGNITLPAGEYQALDIVIGSGQGKNWWCVMFPPLCFIDIAHGVAPEDTAQKLKEALSEDEYKLVVSAKTGEDIPVKLRFKLVEIIKDMNGKLAKIARTHP